MDFEHYLLDTLFYLPVILPYCICHFHSCQLGTCQSFSASISPENPNIFLHPPVTSYCFGCLIRIPEHFSPMLPCCCLICMLCQHTGTICTSRHHTDFICIFEQCSIPDPAKYFPHISIREKCTIT